MGYWQARLEAARTGQPVSVTAGYVGTIEGRRVEAEDLSLGCARSAVRCALVNCSSAVRTVRADRTRGRRSAGVVLDRASLVRRRADVDTVRVEDRTRRRDRRTRHARAGSSRVL